MLQDNVAALVIIKRPPQAMVRKVESCCAIVTSGHQIAEQPWLGSDRLLMMPCSICRFGRDPQYLRELSV